MSVLGTHWDTHSTFVWHIGPRVPMKNAGLGGHYKTGGVEGFVVLTRHGNQCHWEQLQ